MIDISKNAIEFFENANKVYNLMEDETSRDILRNRLMLNITNDPNYLDSLIKNNVGEFENSDHSADVFSTLHQKIKETGKKVVIYGAGSWGHGVYGMVKHGVTCFCDRDKRKQGMLFNGLPVISLEELLESKDEYAVIVGTAMYSEEAFDFLQANGIEILSSEGCREYFRVFAKLVEQQYFDEEIISFSDDEVFIDGGCFNFITSKLFLGKCGNGRVIAFEPDPGQYTFCLENSKNLKNVTIYPYGLWNNNSKLGFDNTQNPSVSRITEDGADGIITIETVALDDILSGERATFIKLDIEGAELNALRGAQKTISAYRPKLAICVYHKPEDIIDIPLYLHSLVPEYKFFMRHYSSSIDETVLYAVLKD